MEPNDPALNLQVEEREEKRKREPKMKMSTEKREMEGGGMQEFRK